MITIELVGGPADGLRVAVTDDTWVWRVYQVGEVPWDYHGKVEVFEHLYERPDNGLDYRWRYRGPRVKEDG